MNTPKKRRALFTALGLLACAGGASAQTTPDLCTEKFSRSQAAATCRVSSAIVPPGSDLCQMQISCQRDDGSFTSHNGAFVPRQLPYYCNRNGELKLGCNPKP